MARVPGSPETARAPTGTRDVFGPGADRFEAAVDRFRAVVEGAGYGLLQSPIFEYVSVFRRAAGEQTDVGGKEMYEFADRDGQVLALRPEGTASVVRAFVQHHPLVPWKVWYMAPMLRHERPQAARLRQHHQVGAEMIGVEDPDADIELIWIARTFFSGLGLRDFTLHLGSMGDAACRPAFVEDLRAYLRARRDTLCEEHRERFELSPLRVLDCKRAACHEVTEHAPRLIDALCPDCRAHFERVRAGLDALGIDHTIDDRLVRGFDYYTRTTFEFESHAIEAAQNAIGGGGRYDGLVELLGGTSTPGVGFGIGVERVLVACDAEGAFDAGAAPLDAYVVDVVDGAAARRITALLREEGLKADRSFDGRSMKAQMKLADRSGARFAVIVGPAEADAGTVVLRGLRDDTPQFVVPEDELVGHLRRATGSKEEDG